MPSTHRPSPHRPSPHWTATHWTATQRLPIRPLLALAVLLLALGALAPSVLASEEGDPVIQGVIHMLGAEVSEPIILQWLDASPEPPGLPTPSDLVALRDAGASDELLSALIGRARQAESSPKASSPQAARPSAPPASPLPASPASPAPAPAPAAAADDAKVETRFELSYSPYVLEGEDGWDFYVYLDGVPLSYVPESGFLDRGRLTFFSQLAAGQHRLRFVQERHRERKGRTEHRARVGGVEVVFELAAGQPAQVEALFSQSLLGSKNPISYRVAQGGRVVTLDEEVGGEPDDWQEVCEDLELSLDGEEPSRAERRRLEGCVRWADLWPAGSDGPSREQILEALARFDYRPTPKNQRLH